MAVQPATSGTYGQTYMTVDRIISNAMALAKLPASRLTPENVILINETLWLLLIKLTALGINLWTVNEMLFGIYPGEIIVNMPPGTTDILEMSYRTTYRVAPSGVSSSELFTGQLNNLSDSNVDTECNQLTPDGNFEFDLGSASPAPITTIGVLPSITATWDFTIEQSSDQLTWVPILDVTNQAVINGRWLWYQLEPSVTLRFMRIRISNGGLLSLREFYLCNQYNDIPISRLNRDDYASYPYKQFPSQQPLQGWVERRQDVTRLRQWPAPSTTFACLWMMIYQETQDIGGLTNRLAVPNRALPGIVEQLAVDMIFKIPGGDETRLPALTAAAQKSILISRSDEVDNSPIMLGPDISPYTR